MDFQIFFRFVLMFISKDDLQEIFIREMLNSLKLNH